MHQVMRRAIEDDVTVVQHKKVGLGIQLVVGDGNHMVLRAVEHVGGEGEGILQAVGDQQRTGAVNIALLHDQLNDSGRSDRVQSPGGGVVKQQVGPVNYRAGDRNPAAHAP